MTNVKEGVLFLRICCLSPILMGGGAVRGQGRREVIALVNVFGN